MAAGGQVRTNKKPRLAAFDWTENSRFSLIEEYRLAIEQGWGADNGLKNKAWEMIATSLNTKGISIAGTQCKNAFAALKATYSIYERLLSQSGFGVSPEHQGIIAPDSVWDEYINSVPKAAQFRNAPKWVFYDKMHKALGGNVVTGEDAVSMQSLFTNSDDDDTYTGENNGEVDEQNDASASAGVREEGQEEEGEDKEEEEKK